MINIVIAVTLALLLGSYASARGRKHQLRVQRIRRVHGPDARIRYMNVRGKKSTLQISIESVRHKGKDWIVTAWCYEKNEFIIFYASRMYEYFDLSSFQEVKNVPAYFTERYSKQKAS